MIVQLSTNRTLIPRMLLPGLKAVVFCNQNTLLIKWAIESLCGNDPMVKATVKLQQYGSFGGQPSTAVLAPHLALFLFSSLWS